MHLSPAPSGAAAEHPTLDSTGMAVLGTLLVPHPSIETTAPEKLCAWPLTGARVCTGRMWELKLPAVWQLMACTSPPRPASCNTLFPTGGIILPNGGGGECRQLLPQAEEGSLAEL